MGDVIDRLEVRRAVAQAANRIRHAFQNDLDAKAEERTRLHKAWRDLSEQAEQARKAYDLFMKRYSKGSAADHAIIDKAKKEHPDLLTYEHDDHAPICCIVSGLALFEGDEVAGDPEYGAVLKAAVALTVEPVDG